MKKQVILFILFVSIPLFAQQEKRGYFIQENIMQMLDPTFKPQSLIEGNGVHYIELTDDEASKIATFVHEETHKCGGGIEVVDPQTLASFGAQYLVNTYWEKPVTVASLVQSYSIQYPNTTRHMIGKVQLSRQQSFLTGLTSFNDRYCMSSNGTQASTWIKTQMENAAAAAGRSDITVELIATTGRPQPSIVVKVPGLDPSLSAIVIGGHMDTTAPPNKPGADDDASGSSTVAEVFYSIINSTYKFKRTIYFAFYAAEEVGLFGSLDVVNTFQSRGISVYAAMQLDMSGYKSAADSFDMYVVMDNVSHSLTTFIRNLAKEYLGMPAMGDTYCNYKCSDHARWNDKGVPVAFPFETSFNNSNHNIHTANDTVINWDYAIKFTKLGVSFVTELAEPVDYSNCQFCRYK